MVIPNFNIATLEEKQMYYYNGSRCIYCKGETQLLDSTEVYSFPHESYGLMHVCRPCKAHVGCHDGTDQSLGTVAKESLRNLRRETHNYYFNPLWEKKMALGFSKTQARRAAYTWVAKVLNIDRVEAHVGYFLEEQCLALIAECKKYIAGTPENEIFKATYEPEEKEGENLGALVNGTYEGWYDLRPISATYYDLISRDDDKKIFRINIKQQIGRWINDPKSTWNKIANVEKFVNKHFKPKVKNEKKPRNKKTA